MKKLIEIMLIIGAGYLLIKFMRWVYNMAIGPAKFAHFGYSTFGFNVVEFLLIIFIVIFILGSLLKKE